MKTLEEFYEDSHYALKKAAEYLESKGYKTEQFTNLNGEEVLSVHVEDDEGEQSEYIVSFERY